MKRAFCWLSVALGVTPMLACAGTSETTSVACPQTGAERGEGEEAGREGEGDTLPAYFSVEIGPGDTLVVDGAPVTDLAALEAIAARAREAGGVAGAAVLARPEYSAVRRHEVVRILVDAGFASVRFGSAPAMAEEAAPAEETPSGAEPRAAAAVSAVAPPASDARPEPAPAPAAKGKIVTIGLHIGGGANDDASRQPLLRVLETSFPDLSRCYAALSGVHKSQSFGVDILIPKSGAPPEVKDVRTRLGDDAFRSCAVRAFQKLTFEPPERGRTMVSYSVRFDPGE